VNDLGGIESLQNENQVRVENLVTSFQTRLGVFNAVNGVSYSIPKGRTLGIVGESGCGKSVTSFSLMRLIEHPGKISSGKFFLDDAEIFSLSERQMQDQRGKNIAMIFQEPMTALNPVLTIGEQIREVLVRHLKLNHQEARAQSIEALTWVGIPSPSDRAEQYPHQLSGGMRQRAMIAMALACKPKFLIADEPTTALDVTIQAQVLELIKDLQSQFQMTVQFITHDLGVISEISDDVMVMYAGRTIERCSSIDLFRSPLHPYTEALIQSRPKIGTRSERLNTIEGSVPAPHELPKGCAFRNRCPRAKSECSGEAPPLLEIKPNHAVACFNPLV
jgi:peptide/nickel transport system ATP-binding protein